MLTIRPFYAVLSAIVLLCVSFKVRAQSFDTFFADSTLRIDYNFCGNNKEVRVHLVELQETPKWYGRRHHLDSLQLLGNGRVTVRDSISNKVIYRTSFSSLFQEWLRTDEAKKRSTSFEHVALVPYPRRTALVEIELDNTEHKVIAKHRFYLNPLDILIRHRAKEPPVKHDYMHQGRDAKRAIDIVILAEGYTEEQMPAFLRDAKRVSDELLRYEPFAKYKDRVNIIAVKSISREPGVSVPRDGVWKRTAFSSHFDTFYSQRYLTTSKVFDVHDALVNIPYEHIIILANTETYGGGGIYNSYTLSSIHPKHFLPVVVHEFGHSFGGLADEYHYEKDTMNDTYSLETEPWEQNITSLKDFFGKKWSPLIKRGTPIPTPKGHSATYGVGVYEGAAYTAKGLYKATEDCRMRTNSYPTFCPACYKALDELIRYNLGE